MARLSYPPRRTEQRQGQQRQDGVGASAAAAGPPPASPTTSTTKAKTLAILGTGSDVGKTVIVCGICRLLSRNNQKVVPFKAQNMSNNSSPALISPCAPPPTNGTGRSTDSMVGDNSNSTESSRWGEIGTAQALQAQACGLVPRVEMNPILLKSGGRRNSDGACLCSVIVNGKHYARVDYGTLGVKTDELRQLVLDAHSSLLQLTNSEIVIVEGAGSCTELNLMDRDVVNIPLVRQLNCPWLLVADIDKGGVFAQIIGTKECLSSQDWDLCCGIIVNRLRGDAKYFEPGPQMIQQRVGGKPVFVVPWLYDLNLPEEDGVSVETRLQQEKQLLNNNNNRDDSSKPVVVIVAYPYVSITSDLIPLERDPNIIVEWRRHVLPPSQEPYRTHAIILPGSRLTRTDLDWLISSGWRAFIKDHVRRGGVVLGLCGGYQMLGHIVKDEEGIEGEPGSSVGLGLLPVETTIAQTLEKIVTPRTAILKVNTNGTTSNGITTTDIAVEGFELHCGKTTFISDNISATSPQPPPSAAEPLLEMVDGTEKHGGVKRDRVSGTYLHGILDNRDAMRALLHLPSLSEEEAEEEGRLSKTERVPAGENSSYDDSINKLADHLESCGLTPETILGMIS